MRLVTCRLRRGPGHRCPPLIGLLALLPPVSAGYAAWADQLDVAGKRYARGKIIGVENGEIRFRKETLEIIGFSPVDVERIYVEPVGDFADFNAAEELLAGGNPAGAVPRYERMLRMADGFWPDLIRTRLLITYDRLGEIDKATAIFLRVLEGEFTGPAVAARAMPANLPRQGGPALRQAVEMLDRAAGRNSPPQRQALVLLLKYDLLRTAGDDRAGPMAPVIAELRIPANVMTPRCADIQLAALNVVLADPGEPRGLAWLDHALTNAPPFATPALLLLKGRTLLQRATTRDDRIRAGWVFMRIVAHFPDDALCADALLGAAEVHTAIGRTDRARLLLNESVRHPKASPATRQAAQERLEAMPADARGIGTGKP